MSMHSAGASCPHPGVRPGHRRPCWRSLVADACLALALLCPAGASAAEAAGARVLLQTSLVAGLAHHDAKDVWEALRVGDTLALVRQDANVHDMNAVVVTWNGRMLGYLPKSDNVDVARMIDRGQPLQARIRSIAKYRNHRRKLEIDVFMAW